MAKYTITVQNETTTPSLIIENSLVEDNCSSVKSISVIIPDNSTKFVSIVQSGIGSSYIGSVGNIDSNSDYTLMINGDNSVSTRNSGTIIFSVKDQPNGVIEDQLIFTRGHSGIECDN